MRDRAARRTPAPERAPNTYCVSVVTDGGNAALQPQIIGRSAELDLLVRHLDDAGQVLLTGAAGVGKSTMLQGAALLLEERGFAIHRVAGTAALIDHPLAALGHLIGDPGEAAGPALIAFGVDRLRKLARGSQAVLMVDDAHALDAWSLHVIGRARADDGPRVVLAARGGSSLTEAVAVFGRHPGLTLQILKLSGPETAELAAALLGRPLDTPSADRIHRATDGLPLAIVELLRYARRHGALVERHGLLRWDGGSLRDRQLAELLGLRIDDLRPAERDVVEAISIVGELPMDVVRQLSPGADLVELEAQRLVGAGPRAGTVVLGHPLLRDAVTSLLAPVRRELLVRRLAGLLAGADDPLMERLGVVLAVEVDAPIDADVLLATVRWGRSHGLWAWMAPVMARAWTEHPGPFTGLAYGESLYWQRRMVESEVVLAEALALCAGDADRIALATARARTLEIGLGRAVEAEAVRSGELDVVWEPSQRLEVCCAQSERWLFDGHVDRILEIYDWAAGLTPTAGLDGPFGAARYRLTQSSVGALGLKGRRADMSAEYELQHDLALRHAGTHPLVGEVTDPWWVATSLLAGELQTVDDLLERRYTEALTLADGLSRPLWALPRSIRCWLAGDLVAAEHFAREAMGVPDAVVSIRRMATHFLARALECDGQYRDALVQARMTAGDDYVGVVRTWSAGLEYRCRHRLGELPTESERARAERLVLDAIDEAISSGQAVPAAYIAHDLARTDAAEAVVDRLDALASTTDAASVRWMSAHARALAGGPLEDLVAAAEDAVSTGCLGLAHTFGDAAVELAARRRNHDVAVRAAQVLATCRESNTGGVNDGDDLAARFRLTAREAEIARAAAAGLTDQEIADGFYLSVRTVNAHLRSVYRKVGISSRRELGVLADPVGQVRLE